jgi:hypothetical protein
MTVKTYRAAVIVGILLTQHHASQDSNVVSTYNSGFADSKLDDCQQGSVYACAWLDSAH